MAETPRAISYFIHRGAETEKRRALLKASHGRLGTGSQHIAVGDLVALRFGVAMPLVLRRHQEGHHQVVGPWFVHGFEERRIMDGNGSGKIQFDWRVGCLLSNVITYTGGGRSRDVYHKRRSSSRESGRIRRYHRFLLSLHGFTKRSWTAKQLLKLSNRYMTSFAVLTMFNSIDFLAALWPLMVS